MSPLIDPANVKYVEIFPPVGIARLGNSEEPDGYFVGPEVPGNRDVPEASFKDAKGAVKRQAARFRVYGYNSEGKVLGELNHQSGYKLDWAANIANSKAAYHKFHGRYTELNPDPTQIPRRNHTVQGEYDIEDRVDLIISAAESVEGINQPPKKLEGKFKGRMNDAADVYLGELRTDEQGRLVFLGGRGRAYSPQQDTNPPPMITSAFDQDDWVDDTSDGRITVSVTHSESSREMPAPKHSAWVVCAPPKFAWGGKAPTSLYDLFEEVYEAPKREALGRKEHLAQLPDPEFYKDIWPIFEDTQILSWLNKDAMKAHGLSAKRTGDVRPYSFLAKGREEALSKPHGRADTRAKVFQYIRAPHVEAYATERSGQLDQGYMPRLSGEDYDTNYGKSFASLTELQYQRLQKWVDGDFSTGTKVDTKMQFEKIDPSEQPRALTKAALEWTIGAPLYPGIEVYWRAALPDWYDFRAELRQGIPLDPPFRIDASKVKPGHLTRHLSLPWQSDFYMCRGSWWPFTRPDHVVTLEKFNQVAGAEPSELAKAFGELDMVDWDRGLAGKGDVDIEDHIVGSRPGQHSMVMHWSRLSFVAPAPDYDPSLPPILVEEARSERLCDATP